VNSLAGYGDIRPGELMAELHNALREAGPSRFARRLLAEFERWLTRSLLRRKPILSVVGK
jgi:hypothetical protein